MKAVQRVELNFLKGMTEKGLIEGRYDDVAIAKHIERESRGLPRVIVVDLPRDFSQCVGVLFFRDFDTVRLPARVKMVDNLKEADSAIAKVP